MLCEQCHNPVRYVITVFRQEYSDEGAEAGVSKHHICVSCIQSLDSDSIADDSESFIGTPRTR